MLLSLKFRDIGFNGMKIQKRVPCDFNGLDQIINLVNKWKKLCATLDTYPKTIFK